MALLYSFISKYLLNNYSLLSSVGTRDVVFKQNRHRSCLCEVYNPGRGYISVSILYHAEYSNAVVRNL